MQVSECYGWKKRDDVILRPFVTTMDPMHKAFAEIVKNLSSKDGALENATELQCTEACSSESEGGCQNIFKNEKIPHSDTNV